MNDAKFDEIWNNTIKPILEYQLSDSQIHTTLGIYGKSRAYDTVKSQYNSLRDEIKRNFMRNINGRIDRHKICACMYKAIVEVQIFEVRNSSLGKNILVNAQAAFLASCVILTSFILDDAKKTDANYEAFLRNQKIPCFPGNKNSDSKDSYGVQTLKALCHDQRYGKLSVLELANIFRLLEKHTDSVYKRNLQSQAMAI